MKNHQDYMNEARAAFMIADEAWWVEVQHEFGKQARIMRYTSEGRGAEHSILRRLYDHRRNCQEYYQAARKAFIEA